MNMNKNYTQLEESYLFSTIQKRKEQYMKLNPNAEIISLGIGDVTRPLADAVIQSMHAAVEEMSQPETFHGYGEEQGYEFLRSAVASYYSKKDVSLHIDEIFISDGAKSDLGNILDLFSSDNIVWIPDPVYPVYVDTNRMDGRKIHFLKGTKENGFLPMPESNIHGDIVYLCSPNNPTGACYNREQLKIWVDWANEHQSIILFDSAYEAFIKDVQYPTSIYEIEGSKTCAIEFCSLSKTAGFTGVRCGYTIIPKELVRENLSLHHLWLRRQTTKFNGVSYIVQQGAKAVFSNIGLQQIKENINYYQNNAAIISKTLESLSIWHTGGVNSPYIWFSIPSSFSSWEFFDFLLENAQIIGTPGCGFGEQGEGWFRFSAFNEREKVEEAMRRLKEILV